MMGEDGDGWSLVRLKSMQEETMSESESRSRNNEEKQRPARSVDLGISFRAGIGRNVLSGRALLEADVRTFVRAVGCARSGEGREEWSVRC